MKNPKKQSYKALGVMSGSSLDGIDLAYCTFTENGVTWDYRLKVASTIPYDERWIAALKSSTGLPPDKLFELHILYGRHLGEVCRNFITEHRLIPDLIAAHGHTVFHTPEKGFSIQLGDGQAMSVSSGQTVICNFRSKDIALGGQGAPLVPVGDEYLFGEYDYCLNLGGIANISYQDNNQRIAFDICPANQMLNHLARQQGKTFDDGGNIARTGGINHDLLNMLNADGFYTINPPKSLSNHYVWQHFISKVDLFNIPVADKLRTVTEHITMQLSSVTRDNKRGRVLVTGGGVHNGFLIERLSESVANPIIIPGHQVVDFKEALIFAFLGILRIRNESNCLASVTGAIRDCSGGVVYYP